MPRFRVRTEDPNSEHFRVYGITADSEEDALAWIEAKEAKLAALELDEETLEKLEAKEASDDTLTGGERGALHQHRATDPYVVAYAIEKGDPIPQDAVNSERKALSKGKG